MNTVGDELRNRPAASLLLGMRLDDEWDVVQQIPRPPGGTGGHFSYGYVVRSATRGEAFLKALDYSDALHDPQPAMKLQSMTAAFLFEANLVELCGQRRMTHVVRAIGRGTVLVPGCAIPTVEYLIFELADGDVRTYLHVENQFDLAWVLRTLHHVATGLDQLHRAQVAHQDLKPSNVLTFQYGRNAKVADLGRASVKGQAALHDDNRIAGDWGYAPPELLYGALSVDWGIRRQACDMYHFGSLIAFFFANASVTPLLMQRLQPEHRWNAWGGSYEDVLPYIQQAFASILVDIQAEFPMQMSAQLIRMVRELCEPDPAKRGHPRNRIGHSNPFSLERYVSDLNALARTAETQLKKRIS